MNNNNGRGISKSTTPEEQNNLRRAKKLQQKPGSKNAGKNHQTTPTLLKEFDPETFEVRTCAATLLTTPHKEKVVEAFGKFFTKNSDDAFALIWALTFKPEEKHPLLLKVLALSPEMVSDLPMFLKELAAQYRAYVDPSFMLAPNDMNDEVRSAFNALYTESHAAALFVYEMCANYLVMNPADMINRAVYLLGHHEEKSFFGGILEVIKAVHMPSKEDRYDLSSFLKPRHEKVHDLLKAMADVKAAEKKASAATPNPVLAGLGDLCKAAGLTLVGATDLKEVKAAPVAPASKEELQTAKVLVATQVTEGNHSPKDFTYDTVARHCELFSSMSLETAQLKKLGIDPSQILLNLDAVRKFLTAATQLADAGFSPSQYPDKEAAINQVLNAEAARKDAEKLFA